MPSAEMAGRIRELMWTQVGIVRSDDRLARALAELEALQVEPLARPPSGPDAMASRQAEFMRTVALLIVRCARRRRESRGLHYTETYPWRDNERFLRDTVVSR
jgi:L-aspartate oxidase